MSASDSPSTLVPAGITVGLAVFAVVLSLGSFIPMPAAERSIGLIALVFAVHVLIIPSAFVLGGWVMAKVTNDQIAWRNSLSLGLLISCVWMLWKMGSNT